MANKDIPLINDNGDIYIADTDSYTLEIELIDADGGTFGETDKVLVAVKDGTFSKTYFERLFDIEDGAAYFRMSVEDAKKIPAGDNAWSYSVILNARKLANGEITGDEKITPFNGWRKYHVEEDPSDGRS